MKRKKNLVHCPWDVDFSFYNRLFLHCSIAVTLIRIVDPPGHTFLAEVKVAMEAEAVVSKDKTNTVRSTI